MRPTELILSLSYEFTEHELVELGRKLASERFTIAEIEIEKAASAKTFKERLEWHENELYRLARLIRAAQENREVACLVHYNDPNVGEKSFYRKDNGELAQVISMSPDELQEELKLRSEPEVVPIGEDGEELPLTAPTLPTDGSAIYPD